MLTEPARARSIELAEGKPATQSSISQWSTGGSPSQDAGYVNDGVVAREYANHTDAEMFPWWQVDLQADYVINQVTIFNRLTFADRLRGFTLFLSMDGESWEPVHTHVGEIQAADGKLDVPVRTDHLARFVRLRLDQYGWLHLRAVRVYGHAPDDRERSAGRSATERSAAQKASLRERFVAGRSGRSIHVGGFEVFADQDRYSAGTIGVLEAGGYETNERKAIFGAAKPGDRILELGTAIGVVAMTSASIVGAENVATYDANPHILADACRNFEMNGLGAIHAVNAVLRPRAHWRPGETASFGVAREFVASRLGARMGDPDIVEVIEVPTLCLEDELEASGANILVCDIEGGEVDLLMTADLSRIDAILIETHYWAVGKRAISDLLRKLQGDGFDIDLDYSGNHVTLLRKNFA